MTPPPPDSVAQFAADLRELRLASGNPTLEALSIRSGRGRTALSKAFRGKDLPTKKTLTAIVNALDADEDAWVKRWTKVRLAVVNSSSEDQPHRGVHGAVSAGTFRWVTAVVGVVCLTVGLVIGIESASIGNTPAPSPSPQHVAVTPGADPWAEPACQADAVRLSFGTRADHYLLEIFSSQTCNALWGQITRFDGAIQGNSLAATVSVGFQPDTAQTVTATDVQTVHTPLLLNPGRTNSVCLTGTAQMSTGELDLSPSLCADTP